MALQNIKERTEAWWWNFNDFAYQLSEKDEERGQLLDTLYSFLFIFEWFGLNSRLESDCNCGDGNIPDEEMQIYPSSNLLMSLEIFRISSWARWYERTRSDVYHDLFERHPNPIGFSQLALEFQMEESSTFSLS